MFCPTCGSEERQPGQFCRSCGTDLRAVKHSLERPDEITASAVSAREQISRAVADRIRALQSADDLQTVVEEVLPEIEKFLESPEQRRLRRIRGGIITSLTGVGAAALALLMLSVATEVELLRVMTVGVGLGFTLFLIGLGIVLNAFFFTVPRKQLPGVKPAENGESQLDRQVDTKQLLDSGASLTGVSVTEHTTRHLSSKENSPKLQ